MGFDHDGKFCYVWYLIKQKYPHIKGMKDIASATLKHAYKVTLGRTHEQVAEIS